LTGHVRGAREHVRTHITAEGEDRGQVNLKDLHGS
jgi:hypothetical protein